MAAVWLDVTRCTGCGACVEVCPAGALTLVDGKAYLDDALCRGCAACIPVCPADALRPVLEIKAIPVEPRAPVSIPHAVPPSPRTSVLATVIAVGAQLAVQATPLVLQALGRWVMHPRGSSLAQSFVSAAIGRQTRHRWRGQL